DRGAAWRAGRQWHVEPARTLDVAAGGEHRLAEPDPPVGTGDLLQLGFHRVAAEVLDDPADGERAGDVEHLRVGRVDDPVGVEVLAQQRDQVRLDGFYADVAHRVRPELST